MHQEFTQHCPLCGGQATYVLVDYEKRKYFHCATCVEFLITLPAEAKLSKAPPAWRAQHSSKAMKAVAEKVWVVTESSKPKEAGVANPVLEGQYVLRSTLG